MAEAKKKCECCAEEAKFFHSRCCGAHFEGKVEGSKLTVVCEKCGKFVGELK